MAVCQGSVIRPDRIRWLTADSISQSPDMRSAISVGPFLTLLLPSCSSRFNRGCDDDLQWRDTQIKPPPRRVSEDLPWLARIHRPQYKFSQPPGEQRRYTRWSLVFFTRPGKSMVLEPMTDFSVMVAEAARKPENARLQTGGVTAGEWFARRIKNQRVKNRKVNVGRNPRGLYQVFTTKRF